MIRTSDTKVLARMSSDGGLLHCLRIVSKPRTIHDASGASPHLSHSVTGKPGYPGAQICKPLRCELVLNAGGRCGGVLSMGYES